MKIKPLHKKDALLILERINDEEINKFFRFDASKHI
jgi:hypothetical protein